MSITEIVKDMENAAITVVSEYSASVERIWRLWADPRQLEKWWGPPTYPATVTEHDLSAGGTVSYFMTGPEGDRHHGGWHVTSVDPPNRIEMRDYFADADGAENADMPTSTMTVEIRAAGAGMTRMTVVARYPSTGDLEKVIEMGMEEGMRQAQGQIDGLLRAREPAAG